MPDAAASATITERISARATHVVVRASRAREAGTLQERGASLALVPEAEGALAFARVVLTWLDFGDERTEHEIQAERDRSPLLLDQR